MWVMTTRGFYSAVQDREVPTRLLIRARSETDIRALKDVLPECEPWRLSRSDYEWRLSCTVAEWAGALANMALDIDYANFKNAVTREQGGRRAAIYHSVWSVLLRIERPDRFGGYGNYGYGTATKVKTKAKQTKAKPKKKAAKPKGKS